MSALGFIHDLNWDDIPAKARDWAPLHLLDLVGIAVGGATTEASRIVRDFAASAMPGDCPLPLDGRAVSAPGYALSLGMTIDALDGHDGFNPAKGHIGCPLIACFLALAPAMAGRDALTALVMGYEFGARAAMAQHATAPDYHASGSWGAVTGAAAGARVLGFDDARTRHALGIAEYHGPRAQMMRCIDHPTMVKDASAWGAHAGTSAVLLAKAGFTGAPALIVEDVTAPWADLGERWYITEQYHKPTPVCRWAQPPLEAALALVQRHAISASEIAGVEVATFHESTRLATTRPRTTEEAQYSTSFPVAVALVRGSPRPADLTGDALHDPEVLRLSDATRFVESEEANAVFPLHRKARVTLELFDGRVLSSDWHEPRWDPTAPASEAELSAKFAALTHPVIGAARANALQDAVMALVQDAPLDDLRRLLAQPIN